MRKAQGDLTCERRFSTASKLRQCQGGFSREKSKNVSETRIGQLSFLNPKPPPPPPRVDVVTGNEVSRNRCPHVQPILFICVFGRCSFYLH